MRAARKTAVDAGNGPKRRWLIYFYTKYILFYINYLFYNNFISKASLLLNLDILMF